MNTFATSGRVNSTGRHLALAEHLPHLRPERNTRSSGPCGHDFVLAIEPHTLHQNVCSKNIGSMSSSCGSNSSKMSCAS